MNDQLLTTGQISRMLGWAPRTVAKCIDSGKLPGYRMPHKKDKGDRRVSRAAFDLFCRENDFVILAPYGDPFEGVDESAQPAEGLA